MPCQPLLRLPDAIARPPKSSKTDAARRHEQWRCCMAGPRPLGGGGLGVGWLDDSSVCSAARSAAVTTRDKHRETAICADSHPAHTA
jgi:hypothetical protein